MNSPPIQIYGFRPWRRYRLTFADRLYDDLILGFGIKINVVRSSRRPKAASPSV